MVLRPRFHTFVDLNPSKLARRGARARAEAREGLGEARAPLDGGEQQRRGLPPAREGGAEVGARGADLAHAAEDVGQAELRLRPVHRPAAPRGEAVAEDPHDVDVGGRARDPLVQAAQPLVDERQQAALDELVGGRRRDAAAALGAR